MEGSGPVIECLTPDQGSMGLSLTGIVVLEQESIYQSFVLVQPRKTCPYITERLLMGRKELKQKKNKNQPLYKPRHVKISL